MDSQEIQFGDTKIRILSTIKGLVSEAKIVETEIELFEPDLVALSLGPDEIDGTRKWDGQPYDMSGWDEIYGLSLRKIVGKDGIKLPPPSFTKAIEISDFKGIEIIGIDMDEEAFTDSYTSNISTWQLYKRGRLERHMAKNGIEGDTPEEIVNNMESSIREIQGFAKLEDARVRAMYQNLIDNLGKQRILAIIDLTNVEKLKQTLDMKKHKFHELSNQRTEPKSVNITNVNYNIKDSVINRSDLSHKKD